MSADISEEEAKKAISEEADDDDFKDAVEEEEVDGSFPVSEEELSIIRAELACEFPEDYTALSDAYILSVASKPYSKDPSIRRPLDVSLSHFSRQPVIERKSDSLHKGRQNGSLSL
jgi:hypothetical protein